MRLHRFYIAGEALDHITNEDLVHQWRSVFRMKPGEGAVLFGDDGIEYTCTLAGIDKKSAAWTIESSKGGKRAERELILSAALVKKDNFDLIIRQATEIGVTRIIPIISERSEKKGLNMERAKRILIEATEQCGRVDVPVIDEPSTLSCALSLLDSGIAITAFDPRGDMIQQGAFSNSANALFIGPEGGWTNDELKLIETHGRIYSLPTFVLRAETAAVTVLAIAQAQIQMSKK